MNNPTERFYLWRNQLALLTVIAVSLLFLACNVTAQAIEKQGKVPPVNTPLPIELWVRMPNTPTPSLPPLENSY